MLPTTALPSLPVGLSVSIRCAEEDDLPLLEWDREMWGMRGLFRRAYEDALHGLRLMLVADMNGCLVGRLFVQVCPGNDRYADGLTRGYLYSLHVMGRFQGRGIGTRLIAAGEAALCERGFRWATIAVADTNTGARQLYERLGYRIFRTDNSRWSYFDPDGVEHVIRETCFALKKPLRAGPSGAYF